ncbi:hypothetical protein CPLU01_16074 [Colletotrichum plurivorum]|uniref:F-box domain-containing protein n=1 Tax=Colletotrichum plurivorum TaxID=2175906 RepID=A0A8H6J097_9PEZI|nr:hypothetical protein CPLU01_16074 [Colletotrichum plurivorum]
MGADDRGHVDLGTQTNKHDQTRLDDLPFDIYCVIAAHLDYGDVVRLKASNKRLCELICLEKVVPRSTRIKALQYADRPLGYSGKYGRRLWACFGCDKFLPGDAFGDRMRHLKVYKMGRKKSQSGMRRCWTCAINERLYEHLQPVKKQGIFYYLCHKCGRMQTESQRCKSLASTDAQGSALDNTVCFDDHQPAPVRGLFENLPLGVLQRIVQNTELIDAISMRLVNHYMRDTVETGWVPLHRRFEFIKQWEPGSGVVNVTPRLPCYACFTAKIYTKFSSRQHALFEDHPETFWKRRCNACVDSLYRTRTHLALNDLRHRAVCETCHLLKDEREPCLACLEQT